MKHRPDAHLQAAFDATRDATSQLPTPDQHAHARQQFLSEALGTGISPDGGARLNDQGSAPLLLVQSGEPDMNRKTLRFTRFAAAILLGVLLAGGFWAFPGLRALAQEIIEFFTTADSDYQADVVFVGVPPEQTGEPYIDPYTQSLEEIVTQASFDVYLPTFIPRTLTFSGASYRSEPEAVEITYDCRGTPFTYTISQYPSNEDQPPMEVGWSATIENVPIHETVGQYVKGWWLFTVDQDVVEQYEGAEESYEVPATRVWSNNVEMHWLYWREDGINFSIRTTSGSLSNDVNRAAVCRIDKEVLAEMANGLLPGSQINAD